MIKRSAYYRHLFLTTALLLVARTAVSPHMAYANPTGGAVTGGSATISQTATTTVIQQSTNRAIIGWDSFDVHGNETVKFQQPSASSITVNRIRDNNPSHIDGSVTANGQIVLINPNGVLFGAGSKVDVSGLVATSSDIADDNAFLANGKLEFTKPGKRDARIVNDGTITVRNGGLAGLVAPNVENNGIIEARLGRVQLAGGDIHTIDFAGDGLIKLEVSDKSLSQSVKNNGTIRADGGSVLMTTAQARSLLEGLITNKGTIRANTEGTKKGTIKIDGGLGKVVNEGNLITQGDNLGEAGGNITVVADQVVFNERATADTSGDTFGGSILLGGGYQGTGNLPHSQYLFISDNAVLNASSRSRRKAGSIVLWSDDTTDFRGHAMASGDDGLIEVSGKKLLNFDGTVDLLSSNGKNGTLLLDPTNITISAAASAFTSGSSPFTPSADDATSILNATILQNALASGNVIVQTRATGAQLGNITVDSALTWTSGSTLTLDAHNQIILNQAITGGSLSMIAGGDVQVNANLTGTGNLTIQQRADNITMGLGASAVGTVNLTALEIAKFQDGWANIILGRQTATAAMDVRALTWNDSLTLRSGTGTITVNGIQTITAGNNMTITTDGDIALALTNAITGNSTGSLTINQASAATTIGLGGGAGTINLTATEIARMTNNWSNVYIGRTDGTGAINISTATWSDPLTILSGTGVISIAGVQTMGTNNLSFTTDADISIAAVANILYGSGILTFRQTTASTGIGLGDSQTGALNLTTAEISRIRDGWSSIVFGATDATGAINLGTSTWLDHLTLQTGSGNILVNATPTMTVNNLNMTTATGGSVSIDGAISQTTGNTTVSTSGAGTITSTAGITQTTGALSLTTTGGAINLGGAISGTTTGIWSIASNNGAVTLSDVTKTGGTVTINSGTGQFISNGVVNLGAANTTVNTSGAAGIALNNTVTQSTGNLTLTTAGGTITAGALAAMSQTTGNLTMNSNGGNITLDAALLQSSGASGNLSLTTGNGILSVNGAVTRLAGTSAFNSGTGAMTFTQALNLAAANATFDTTGTAAINLTNSLTQTTGNSTFTTTGGKITTTGISQTTGNLTMNSGGGNIAFDGAVLQSSGATGAVSITTGNGTLNFANTVTRLGGTNVFNSGTGAMTFTQAVNLGAANATFDTTGSAGITLSSTLTQSTGNATFTTFAGAINLTGAVNQTSTGNLTLNTAGGNISTGAITQTTGNLTATSQNGTMYFGGAITKTGGLMSLNSGSGLLTLASTTALGAGAATIVIDSNIVIGDNFSGTGALSISQATDNVSIAVGTGQTGTVHIDSAEYLRILNGWSAISLGRIDSKASMNIIGGLTWNDNLTLQTGTGAMNINGAQAMGANTLTLRTDSNIQILGALSGTSTFALIQASAGTSMGIGDGQAGTINLTSAEQAFIVDGWSSRTFGRNDATGDMNIGASTWTDSLILRSGSGAINLNGAQAFVANNLSIVTDSNLLIGGTLSSTGTLLITGASAATTIGLGTGQTGMLSLDDTELTRLGTTWTSMVLGSTTATGAINIGSRTWFDPLTLRVGTGVININGTMNLGANNMAITTDGDINILGGLTGTGTLTIAPTLATTTIGLGTGQSGTILLEDGDLNKITDGWSSIIIGTTSLTGSMNVGARTWTDNITLRTGTGAMNINGAQSVGANNMTLTTGSNLAISGNITGTGVLSITPAATTGTIGIGTGQSGTLSLTDAELDFIRPGWSSVIFGTTSLTGAINIAARTWGYSADIRTNSGALNINGAQNMGAYNLVLRTNTDLAINQILAGTGTLSILNSGTAITNTMAVGDSQTGQLKLTNAEMDFFKNQGWSTIALGNSASLAALNVGANTWYSNLILRTAGSAGNILNINGAQDVGNRNLTISTNNDLNIGAALTGTGTLSIGQVTATATMGIGTGQSGTVALSTTELGQIGSGWSSLVFGTNTAATGTHGAINVGALNWNNNVTIRSLTGALNINGAQALGSKNLTLQTDSNLLINAALTSTGSLSILPASVATTMGVGSTGTLNLIEAELANIGSGWTNLYFGRTDATGTMNVANRTWANNTTLMTGSGLMTVAGANMGANNLTMSTNSNLAITNNLNGTGKLTIKNASGLTGIGVGTAQVGTLVVDNTEIGFIKDGWSNVTFGSESSFGAINIGAVNWLNPMLFVTQSNVVINGAQTTTETAGTTLAYATTGGAFINNVGAAAINAGTGRYLVYSVNESSDTLNGLTRPTIVTNETFSGYGPASVTETGNVFIYSGIVAKILNLQIDNVDKYYGSTNPGFTFTYIGGLLNDDTLNDIIQTYTLAAAGSTTLDDAGITRTINGSFTLNNGYTVNLLPGTLTVIKADLTVEADSYARQYGIANPTLTYSYSGFKNGDDATDIDTAPTFTTTANLLSHVGNYGIAGSGGIDNNYNFVYEDGLLEVTKAMLTATVSNAVRIYGDTNPAFTVTYSGFRNSDVAGMIDTGATASTSANNLSNVGSYAISATGAADNDYSFTYVDGSLTVNKAQLTATANNAIRTYGDINPAFGVTYSGFKNGQNASVIATAATATSTANALSNVGTQTITASGAIDNNYSFTYVDGSLTINKAVLTATANNASRTYGDVNPAFGVTYSGFKNSDTSSVITTGATATSSANALSNAGSHVITASGGMASNYSFNYVDGTLTINKALLTATANNATRVYGDTNPTFGVTYSGFKNSETDSVITTGATATSAATALTNVGTQAITASGAAANNYNFTYVDGALTITKALLTASTANVSRIYGDANPTFTVNYTGFKNGQNSSVITTGATAVTSANTLSNVGSYGITLLGAAASNYDFNYLGANLTINKAILTATANNASRTYGDTNPAFGVTYSGFKNGENASVVTTGAAATSTANAFTNVGTYTITASGAAADNYAFTYTDGSLTINKALLTATPSNASRIYGDTNPVFTVSYSGFKNGENDSVITTGATATSTANNLSNTGTYVITASGGAANNYDFNYNTGTLTVNKAALTATVNNSTRIYGDTNPAFGVSYSGFKNSENADVIDTKATASSTADTLSDVGSYTIAASGAIDDNYTFNYVDGALNIDKATLTVTPNNVTRAYGANIIGYTLNYTGFKNGETSSVINTGAVVNTGANSLSGVGSYALTASGAFDNNYTFNYVDGTLTVNKALLTATVGNATRAYGDTNPVFNITYTGFKNGENAGVIDTKAAASSAANTTSNVGTYIATASGALDDNYSFTYVNGTLTVDKAQLTATVNNATRIYGDTNSAFNVTYVGFKNGQTASVIDTKATTSSAADATSAVGNYAISATGALDDNYSFTYVDGALTISKAVLTATANNATRVYGDTNPAFGVTYTGFKNSEDINVIDTQAQVSSTASATSNVGSHAITASGALDDNYSFTYVDGTLAVTKALLTATAGNGSRVYGDTNPAFAVTYSGFKNGENANVIDTAATASSSAAAISNVGNYTVVATGALDDNYDFAYADGNLTITKAMLTATANNATRIYGDTNPAFSVNYSGFKNGQNASVINTAATTNSTANTLSTVGSYAITAYGASDNNYDFNYADGNLTISKALLTATVGNATRIYGDSNPTFGITYSGFKNGENASIINTAATATTSATVLSGVGNYAVTATGAIDTNYDFAYMDGTLAVTKATLTATANNASRTYGDTNPTFGITYSGFKNNETSSVINTAGSASSTANAASNVGNYAITASGAADNNYDFSYTDGTLAINKATLNVTAGNATRTYGDTNPAFTVNYTGFKNSDNASMIDTGATASSSANTASSVGHYAIAATGALDNNYDFTFTDGDLTITKALLTATVSNTTRIYGDTNPAFNITYSGFKNGETAGVITTAASASSSANLLSNVGIYSVTATGAADNNYDFNYVAGTLTVNKALLTATANNATRLYGGANPVFDVTYSGFKNGENSGVIDTDVTASSNANATSNVGSYIISTSGGLDNNYAFNYADGSLTINKALLTVTANNASRSYGDANPTFGVSYSGFKNGENASVINTAASTSSLANNFSAVGSYTIAATGALDNNYDFSYTDGTLTINKAVLTATANNANRTYGDANPTFGVTYSGFKNSENANAIDTSATASSTATAASNVGSYAIEASGALDDNYSFNYVDGTLTVNKAVLTATVGNAIRTYGSANPVFSVNYTGFKNGDNASVINSGASASSSANTLSNVGSYAITANGATDNNYSFDYVNGTLTINKAILTATANNVTRSYGDLNPVFGITYTGFKNGENASVIDTAATGSSATNALSDVGSYAVTASGATDNNYDFNYATGALTINKAILTATAGNATRIYGDTNPALGITYSGFKNGENISVIDTTANISTNATAQSNVGNYAITASGGLDNNYSFNYVNGTLGITKAILTATAGNTSRTYGNNNPAFGITYTGFKNGETQSVIDTMATGTSNATAASNVGSYTISAGGALDNNYTFNYATGTLTVNKALLIAKADNITRLTGETTPALSVSYSGFKNNDTVAVIDVRASATSPANTASPSGSYTVTASGATDNNYDFSYQSGTLTLIARSELPQELPPAADVAVTNNYNIIAPPVVQLETFVTDEEDYGMLILPVYQTAVENMGKLHTSIAITPALYEVFNDNKQSRDEKEKKEGNIF